MSVTIDAKLIFEQRTHIVNLLRQHPELRPLQDKIDALMSGAACQHNRNALLQGLLKDQVEQLKVALVQMATSLNSLQEKCKLAIKELPHDPT